MRFVSIIYFLLLAYIVAAIIFWGQTLDQQSEGVYKSEMQSLREHVDSVSQFEEFRAKSKIIENNLNARKQQYTGEGTAFLLVIFIGAGIVYSTIRSRNKLSQQQSNFILSITHELKSPIAAIKLNLQTLAKRRLEEATQQKLIERSVIEADRLDDLCNNLLLASRMEDRHFKSSSERINFTLLIHDVINVMEVRKKEHFISKLEEECFTYGDTLLWKLAVNNLLENAVKYGASGTSIEIELKRQEDQLLLSIKDYGIGISDEEKTKIFKKFYRVGNENSRKTKGTGLGLYLTAKIISQFKGEITIRDNEPKGSIFEISVPIG